MKKLKQAIIVMVFIIVLILMTNQYVYADKKPEKADDFITRVEFSKDFEEWVELSKEDDVLNLIQPKIYDELNTPFIPKNPIYQFNFVGASLNSRYNLKDVIPNNVTIKNQYNTNMCWAFSGLSSLETNLALNNIKTGKNKDRVYDFSERHANYSTTRKFLNDGENLYGFNRTPDSGGQWFLLENYLTNGQGPVEETDMPFQDNSNLIDVEQIENKKVTSQVYDTVYFDDYNKQEGDQRTYVMNEIKQHIQNYGSVFATIHGDSSDSIMYNCYNNDTGAKYCNDSSNHPTDHAISIIGWDDNYSINNFAEGMRPKSNGAWIVRNSWGESIEYDLNEFKKEIFNAFPEQCKSNGWNSPSEIPNDFITSCGYTISGDKVHLKVGDNGYMYISYEDCNVGATLYGITNATDKVDYDYIYQYNELYPGLQISFNSNSTYLCNIFEKKSDEKEYLTEVALTAPETYTCKVYVNPNGASKGENDLQLVKLKAGDSETIDVGYHTLEFAEPIEIKADEFAVVVEITSTRSSIDVVMEGKIDGIPQFDYAKSEKEKCFIASRADLSNCTWFDLGKLQDSSSSLTNGDSSMKAFTVTKVEDKSLNRIEIETPPTKTVYTEGESFDKSGMKIKSYFNNGDIKILEDSDYNIIDGNDLKTTQTFVTITYQDKTVNQPITVKPKQSEEPKNDSENKPSDEKPEDNKPSEDKPIEENKNDENKPENNKSEDNKTIEDKAQSSNMEKANCILKNVQLYYYTEDSSKDFTLIDTEIDNIIKSSGNDSYEYYYYLSPDGSLKTITDWVKIKETQNNKNKLVFKIDSRDIPNYSEISKATDLYIYIKESVVKGGNQSVQISKSMKFEINDTNIDTYVDNVKKQNDEPIGNNENTQKDSNKETSGTQGTTSDNKEGQVQGATKDLTTSNMKLPATGKSILIIFIVVIIFIGIVLFVKYEILNKYVK